MPGMSVITIETKANTYRLFYAEKPNPNHYWY